MLPHFRPVFGSAQPAVGFCDAIPFADMAEKVKRPKIGGVMRGILAANIRYLMDVRFAASGNRPMALAKRAGISLSSVQRIVACDVGASIDNIEAIAAALGQPVYRLLLADMTADDPEAREGAAVTPQRRRRGFKEGQPHGAHLRSKPAQGRGGS